MTPRSLFALPLLSVALAAGTPAQASAGQASAAASQSQAVHAQVERAARIADSLKLADAAKTGRVRDLIARQFADLAAIQDARDTALKAAKSAPAADMKAARSAAEAKAQAAVDALHPEFLARLAAELTPDQIDQVKDGMTYGVVPLTFRVYQEMLPELTAEQKAQIHAWLIEAREHAMDGFTSKEKHAWFGKYKGRINIYLSKAGYNMKAAEKRLFTKH